MLITNDVDEGDPAGRPDRPARAPGPRATLGPSVPVDIERPRDRKAINHDPRFKQIRNEVIEYLLGAGRKRRPRARPAGVPEPADAAGALGVAA